ncbi:hypothetical protein ACFCV3_32275 [Kribbella sp. NPDC056345]|uniref:hypothetical protein n=1 Tax=Kribbella sp. NPDC056345 TaxID=3345789 RepID=UPI0035D68F9D
MPHVTPDDAAASRVVNNPRRPMYSHVDLVTGARSWDDEIGMRAAYREGWRGWGPSSVTSPLLVSGHCPADRDGRGADAMAEMLWRAEGFEVLPVPADWRTYGKRAGFIRNQQMVDLVVALLKQGSAVRCTAFLDLCRRPRCPQSHDQQLMPLVAGHFSHGTVDCRTRAIQAGIETFDVMHPSLRPV